MAHKGLYQPRIADASIRKLYHIAKRHGVKMTQLLNLIVSTAIDELEQDADRCDDALGVSGVAHSPTGGIIHRGLAFRAHRGRDPSQHHDRPIVRHAAHGRERHQRKHG